jgi:hypothetical protein
MFITIKIWIISFLVFIVSLVVTAFIGFYAQIFLIGPHTGILPQKFFIPVAILLLLLIVGIPLWLGRKAFYYFKQKEMNNRL